MQRLGHQHGNGARKVGVRSSGNRILSNILKIHLLNLVSLMQDEVLQVCDQLYLNEKITENQLLYLRHLVLIREEPVAALYDDFQEVHNRFG